MCEEPTRLNYIIVLDAHKIHSTLPTLMEDNILNFLVKKL